MSYLNLTVRQRAAIAWECSRLHTFWLWSVLRHFAGCSECGAPPDMRIGSSDGSPGGIEYQWRCPEHHTVGADFTDGATIPKRANA